MEFRIIGWVFFAKNIKEKTKKNGKEKGKALSVFTNILFY